MANVSRNLREKEKTRQKLRERKGHRPLLEDRVSSQEWEGRAVLPSGPSCGLKKMEKRGKIFPRKEETQVLPEMQAKDVFEDNSQYSWEERRSREKT